jgi:predicted MPP superfamily phosphohydrolase
VLGSNDLFVPKPLNPFRYFVPASRRRRRRARRGRSTDLVAQLGAEGWQDLDNRRALVELGGLPVELAGLHDAHIDADPRVLGASPAWIAVMHSPDCTEAAACGHDLLVAGHTRGARFDCLVGALVRTACAAPPGKRPTCRGDAFVSISQGSARQYAPRFWCPPRRTPGPAEPLGRGGRSNTLS